MCTKSDIRYPCNLVIDSKKDRDRDKRRDDRKRRSDRDDRSVRKDRSERGERSYREWEETPARFRDEPGTPQIRVKGQGSGSEVNRWGWRSGG